MSYRGYIHTSIIEKLNNYFKIKNPKELKIEAYDLFFPSDNNCICFKVSLFDEIVDIDKKINVNIHELIEKEND